MNTLMKSNIAVPMLHPGPHTRGSFRAVLRIPDPPTGIVITDGYLPKPVQTFCPTQEAAEIWAVGQLAGKPLGSRVEVYEQREELVSTIPGGKREGEGQIA